MKFLTNNRADAWKTDINLLNVWTCPPQPYSSTIVWFMYTEDECEKGIDSFQVMGNQRLSTQALSRDMTRMGGATLWGYSPDCHVIFAILCRLFAQKGLQQGGYRYPRTLLSYTTGNSMWMDTVLYNFAFTCFGSSNNTNNVVNSTLIKIIF